MSDIYTEMENKNKIIKIILSSLPQRLISYELNKVQMVSLCFLLQWVSHEQVHKIYN